MKGVISIIEEWITVIITGVLIVGVLPLILPEQVAQISPVIEAKEFENKAITLANVLLGNENIIHSDNRAMFDEQKLNTKMIDKSSFSSILDCPPSEICIKTYPESFSLLLIKDVENNPQRGWFTLARPSRMSQIDAKINSCFANFDKNKVEQLFDENADIPKILNLKHCGFKRYTTILTTILQPGDKPGFPVSIRYNNGDVHIGWTKVMVVE